MIETVTTEPPVTIAPDVPALLKERNAESEFPELLALIRKCFPQTLSLEVYLQDDWAEPTSIRVVIETFLASTAGDDERVRQQWREFDQQLIPLVPLDHLLLFLVLPRYIAR
jgi:hypothetical protein